MPCPLPVKATILSSLSFHPLSISLSFSCRPAPSLFIAECSPKAFSQREMTKYEGRVLNAFSLYVLTYYYSNLIPGIQWPSRSARCIIAHPRQEFYPNDANAYHPIKGEPNGVGAFRHAPSHCSHAWTSIVKAHRAAALP